LIKTQVIRKTPVNIFTPPVFLPGSDTISGPTNPKRLPVRAEDQSRTGAGSLTRYTLLIALAIAIIAVPAAAGAVANVSV